MFVHTARQANDTAKEGMMEPRNLSTVIASRARLDPTTRPRSASGSVSSPISPDVVATLARTIERQFVGVLLDLRRDEGADLRS